MLLLRDGGSPFAMAAGPISERNQGNWERRAQERARVVEGRLVPEVFSLRWETRSLWCETDLWAPGWPRGRVQAEAWKK